MRIPTAEDERGYFYKVGDCCWFVPLVVTTRRELEGTRVGTFREFKALYPYTVYSSGACCEYRTNKKQKI